MAILDLISQLHLPSGVVEYNQPVWTYNRVFWANSSVKVWKFSDVATKPSATPRRWGRGQSSQRRENFRTSTLLSVLNSVAAKASCLTSMSTFLLTQDRWPYWRPAQRQYNLWGRDVLLNSITIHNCTRRSSMIHVVTELHQPLGILLSHAPFLAVITCWHSFSALSR
jgi:hypothetical protein